MNKREKDKKIKRAVVVHLGHSSGWIGLKFDKKINGGHSCNDHCEDGYGYYLSPEDIIPLEDENKTSASWISFLYFILFDFFHQINQFLNLVLLEGLTPNFDFVIN